MPELYVTPVLGCPDIRPPPHAWYKRQGDTIQVGCETNDNSWDLACEGNDWKGVLGNCTVEGIFMLSLLLFVEIVCLITRPN